jgi:hypothetical protein
MRKTNMVNGLPYLEVDGEICEGCILGKHTWESFSNRTWKAREHLALVHSNLCGPMETLSFGKARYFLTFIDDYSKKNMGIFSARKVRSLYTFCLVQGIG